MDRSGQQQQPTWTSAELTLWLKHRNKTRMTGQLNVVIPLGIAGGSMCYIGYFHVRFTIFSPVKVPFATLKSLHHYESSCQVRKSKKI